MRKKLLKINDSYYNNGIEPIHFACFFGKLDIIEILYHKFEADLSAKTIHGMAPLHCAAQNKEGVVGIYYLKVNDKNYNANC